MTSPTTLSEALALVREARALVGSTDNARRSAFLARKRSWLASDCSLSYGEVTREGTSSRSLDTTALSRGREQVRAHVHATGGDRVQGGERAIPLRGAAERVHTTSQLQEKP